MMNISNRHMELTDVVAALGASENLAKGTYEWVAGVTEVDDGTRPPGSHCVDAPPRRLSQPQARGIPVSKVTPIKRGRPAPDLDTPTDLADKAVTEISKALNGILADSFALYLKTKNFHWHVSGPHFRSYHLLFEEQATAIFATTDEIAERVRKIGGTTLRSIGHISALQTLKDNDEPFLPANAMLAELLDDNKKTIVAMRKAHKICDDHEDVATASLLENFIDAAEKRAWFLFEAGRAEGDNAR